MNSALKKTNNYEQNSDRRSIKNERRDNIFGIRLSLALRQKNISVSGLAKLLGVAQPTVSGWIAGKRSPDIYQLKDISEITGKPMEWFFKELD